MLRVHFLFRRKQNHGKVIFYQKHMVFQIRQVEYSRPDTLPAFQPFFCPLFLVFQIRAVFFNFFRPKKSRKSCNFRSSEIQKLVRETGLEPVRVTPHAPQTCASADSATLAYINLICITCECLYTIPPFDANVKHFFKKLYLFERQAEPCLFNFLPFNILFILRFSDTIKVVCMCPRHIIN